MLWDVGTHPTPFHGFIALFSSLGLLEEFKNPQNEKTLRSYDLIRPQYPFSCISTMSFFRPSTAATGSRNSQGSSQPVSRVSSQRIKSPNPTVSPLNFDTMKTPTVHSSGLLASTASSRAKSISPNYSAAPSPSPSTAPGDRKFSFCSVDPNDPDGTVRRFHRLLNKPHTSKIYRSKADIEDALKRLRRYILAEGIPTELVSVSQKTGASRKSYDIDCDQDPSLRPRIWKILLQVDTVDTATYIRYVRKGPCPVREKIRNDTFRYAFPPLSVPCSTLTTFSTYIGLLPRITISSPESERICLSAF